MAIFNGNDNHNTINGTNGDDTINGNGGDDKLRGRGGNDTINGGTGNDEVEGGTGNDVLHGNDDNDQIYGEEGDDTLTGDAGNDTLDGGIGNDNLDGGSGSDVLQGGDGNDTLRGGGGLDLIYGGAGTDTALYSGSIFEYQFFRFGPLLSIVHAGGAGADGSDLVLDVERLQFTDVTIDLTQNNAPIARDDSAATSEDANASGNVLANDFDWEGDTLTVTNPGTYVGSNGTLTLAADGSYTYTPNAAAQGLDDGETRSDSFSYTASDGAFSDTATLTVTITGLNDAPVANDDTASTNEDSSGVSGNVLANDTDIDVEPLTVANPGTYVGTFGTLILAANGSYTYTPGAGAQGLDTGETGQDVFTYSASDGTASDTATLTVSVTGLNDAPVANDDTNSTDENSPVSGNVLTNDTDVDGETLTVANPATFIGGYGTLVLASNGSYTYTPGAGAHALNNGQTANDVFFYIASDGTASDTATLTITVTGLSGAPDAVEDTASTTEDSSVSGNVLANDTDAENDPLTVTNPGTYNGIYGDLTLAANGSYTYTPNAAADGLAAGESADDVFSYTATDGGSSDTATLTVTVNGLNDAPTIDAGGTDADGSVTELPDGDPNEGTAIHSDSGTIAFDDLDLSDTHSASFAAQGGGYLGSFTLDPVDQGGDSVGWDFTVSDAQLENLSEGEVRTQTYTVTVDDGHGGTVTQDVTITLNGAGVGTGPQTVWYIDNSAVGSTNVGTQANPFTSIAAFNAAQGTVDGPQVGHTVFLLAGTGTYAESDGINLLSGQNLIGVADGALRPTIETTGAGNHGIELAQNNHVSGVDVGTTMGAGISDGGGTVGTLVIGDVGVGGARSGQIVDIDQGGLISIQLNEAASTASSGAAIDLNGVSGEFTVSGATTIAGVHSGGGVDVTASSAVVSLEGGGLISTGADAGINFSGNTGALVLGGDLDVVTTSGTGINASGGGSISVTGSGNSIASGDGTALRVVGTAIGGSDITFESISSNGGSAAGIILDSTGTAGGLHVTGTGTAGSGGIIANKSGADGSTTTGVGISLVNTSDVQLAWMQIDNHQNFAIRAQDVNDLALTNSTVGGANGNSAAADEGSILILNSSGTITIADSDISGGYEDNLRVRYDSATADAATYNISGTTFRDLQGAGGATASNALVNLTSTTAASAASNVTFNFTDDIFENDGNSSPLAATHEWGDGIQATFEGGFQHDLSVRDSTFHNLFQALDVGSGSSADVDYVIVGNDMTLTESTTLALGAVSSSTAASFITALIQGNQIGNDGTALADHDSGSRLGNGIVADFRGLETAQITIHDNVVQHTEVQGIRVIGGTSNGLLEVQVSDNVVRAPDDDALSGVPINGIEVQALTPHDVNLDIHGNESTGQNGGVGIQVREQSISSVFNLEGFAGNGTIAADVVAFLVAQNPLSTAAVRTGGSVVNYGGGSATTPPPEAPPMPAAGLAIEGGKFASIFQAPVEQAFEQGPTVGPDWSNSPLHPADMPFFGVAA